MTVADEVRDLRLMQFTSLLRTYDIVSNARVEQCYNLWLDYESKYPLVDGYTRTGKAIDLRNMSNYVARLKRELCHSLLEGVGHKVKV